MLDIKTKKGEEHKKFKKTTCLLYDKNRVFDGFLCFFLCDLCCFDRSQVLV